jgi:[ribosomal protein S18]-alanine N-acetyltransferase
MTIRGFEPKDLDQILYIEGHAFPKSAYTAEMFVYAHRVSPDTFLVFEGDQVLGYILFESNGHVMSVAVDPAYRGEGIATRLMGACMEHVTGERIRVEVREGNAGGQRFYERMGFQYMGRISGYYGTEDAFVYERKI